MTSSPEQVRAITQIARNTRGSVVNRGLLIALLLVTADVLLVAKLQQSTALAILQYTSPVTLFTGVTVNVMSALLLPLIVSLVALGVINLALRRAGFAAKCWVYAATAFVAGALFLDRSSMPDPYTVIMAVIVVGLITGIAQAFFRSRSWSIDGAFVVLVVGSVAVATLLTMLANPEVRTSLTRPFLPAEKITYLDPGGTSKVSVTAYLLNASDDGEWTTLLIEETRTVFIVATDKIDSRRVCSLNDMIAVAPWWPINDPPVDEAVTSCDK